MTVYVDNMHETRMGRYRGMRMSHMIADTDEELFAMADKIGVQRKWFQGDHFDISLGKRKLAVRYGAVEVTMRELAAIRWCKRFQRMYKSPADAYSQVLAFTREKRNGQKAPK